MAQIQTGFTIDAPSSRDLDDALARRAAPGGSKIITVFVTDITNAVAPNSSIDKAARNRAVTVYRSGAATRPMLPRSISENSASLLPNVSRDALAVEFLWQGAGHLPQCAEIYFTQFRSRRRFSYEEVGKLLAGGDKREDCASESVIEELTSLTEAARVLFEFRRGKGAIGAIGAGDGWEITEDLQIKELPVEKRNSGYRIIQEFAPAANSAISRFVLSNKIPFLYRNHRIRYPEDEQSADAADYDKLRFVGFQTEQQNNFPFCNISADGSDFSVGGISNLRFSVAGKSDRRGLFLRTFVEEKVNIGIFPSPVQIFDA